jgi:nitrous oxide reductase accessory protein NosL
MKRIALAVALVVIAAAACQKAEDRGMAADSARADSMRMADSMKADTTHHMAPDTAKARRP